MPSAFSLKGYDTSIYGRLDAVAIKSNEGLKSAEIVRCYSILNVVKLWDDLLLHDA